MKKKKRKKERKEENEKQHSNYYFFRNCFTSKYISLPFEKCRAFRN